MKPTEMAGRQGNGCWPMYTGARGYGARAPQLHTQGGLGGTNFHGPMEPVLHDKEHASSASISRPLASQSMACCTPRRIAQAAYSHCNPVNC